MSAKQQETRQRSHLDIQPDGWTSEDPSAMPATFKVVKVTQHQCRTKGAKQWKDNSEFGVFGQTREVVVERQTPRQLQQFAAEILDWLAYRGEF